MEGEGEVMEGEGGVTPQMYNAALNHIAHLENDLTSHSVYQRRLEREFDASKEEARKGREERQVLHNLVAQLNETIGNLSHENRRLEYERDLFERELRERDMAENTKMEEEEVRRIDAETKLEAAKMQATNWRTRHDKLFDKLAEMEKKKEESIASINEAKSTVDQKLEEADKRTLAAHTELTTSKMKCMVLEQEKEELMARMNELSRSGTQCVVEKRDSVDFSKLIKEKEELAKDKHNLSQRLLNERNELSEKFRKQMAEVEATWKKEKAEWDELRLKLSREVMEAHERIYELETSDSYHELKRLEEEIEELKDDYDKILETKKELAHKLDASRKKVEDMERDLRDAGRRKAGGCDMLEERLKKERDFTLVQTRYDELEKILDSTTNEFKELQSAKKLADEEIEMMREANGRLENERLTVERELTGVRLRVDEMERLARLSTEKISYFFVENERLSARIEEMNSQIVELTKEKSELFEKNTSLANDLENTRTREEHIMRSKGRSIAKAQSLETEKGLLNSRIDEATSMIEELTNEKSELLKNGEMREAHSALLQRRCEEMEKEIEGLNKMRDESEFAASIDRTNLADMKRKYVSSIDELVKLRSKERVLDEQIERMRRAILGNEEQLAGDTRSSILRRIHEKCAMLKWENERLQAWSAWH